MLSFLAPPPSRSVSLQRQTDSEKPAAAPAATADWFCVLESRLPLSSRARLAAPDRENQLEPNPIQHFSPIAIIHHYSTLALPFVYTLYLFICYIVIYYIITSLNTSLVRQRTNPVLIKHYSALYYLYDYKIVP